MKSISPSPEIVTLYDALYRHTYPECKFRCDRDQCCDASYCEEARRFSKETYGIDLEDTGHPDLPFMGASGCVVPPHLRPKCTAFLCTIRDRREKVGDPKWTRKYYELRRKILKQRIRDGIGPERSTDV